MLPGSENMPPPNPPNPPEPNRPPGGKGDCVGVVLEAVDATVGV